MSDDPRHAGRIWTIGELSKEFGVTARALRFYEDRGLIRPQREGLNRLYTARDRARLQLILRGKRVGLTLVEIREILDLYQTGGDQQMRVTHKKFVRQLGILKSQREDLEGAIATLEERIQWLEDQLARAPSEASVAGAQAYERVARAAVDGSTAPAGK